MKKESAIKKTRGTVISVARAVFLLAFSFVLLYPVFFMVSNSVKTGSDLLNPAVEWLSKSPSLYSYKIAYETMNFPKSFLITVRFELVSAIISVFSCALYAYGLSRFDFKLKPLILFMVILIIFVPDIILIIPRVTNFRYTDLFGILGLVKKITGTDLRPNFMDTELTFYLPSLFGVGLKGGLFIFIYMQFFKGLPKELEEAAWVDGAGPFKTFFKIILPSSGVVILTVLIFSVIWHWNDWLLSMMYTNSNKTLAVLVYSIDDAVGRWSAENAVTLNTELKYGIPLAACLIYITPPTVMYLFLQKKFIQSIDRVGIVG